MRTHARSLVAAGLAAAAILAGAWSAVSIRGPGAVVPGGPRVPEARTAGPSAVLESGYVARDLEAREPVRSVPASAAAEAEVCRAVAGLAASLDPTRFRLAEFELGAGAIASELGAQAREELALLAADARRAASERVASAEILRHFAPLPLPQAALDGLRQAWSARATDPALAAAAVRALGAFGNAADRSALLAASTDAAQPQFASLALAGLSAARGDEAALELASAAEAGADPRRAELGLAALCSVAAAKHGGLSPAVRAQCADALERSLEDPKSPEQTRARRRCALAALDPARAPR